MSVSEVAVEIVESDDRDVDWLLRDTDTGDEMVIWPCEVPHYVALLRAFERQEKDRSTEGYEDLPPGITVEGGDSTRKAGRYTRSNKIPPIPGYFQKTRRLRHI